MKRNSWVCFWTTSKHRHSECFDSMFSFFVGGGVGGFGGLWVFFLYSWLFPWNSPWPSWTLTGEIWTLYFDLLDIWNTSTQGSPQLTKADDSTLKRVLNETQQSIDRVTESNIIRIYFPTFHSFLQTCLTTITQWSDSSTHKSLEAAPE